MKRTGLLLITGAVAALTILYVGAAAPTPTPASSEIEQLKKEVADLRQRVGLLEERLKDDLIPATSATTEGKQRPDVINPYSGLRRVPPSWKQGEFNGQPYYIVPLKDRQVPSSQTAPQTPPTPQTPASPQNPDSTPKP